MNDAGGRVVKYSVIKRWKDTRARHAHDKATDANPEGHDEPSNQPDQRTLREKKKKKNQKSWFPSHHLITPLW